ncbi:MAG: chemotaxis response regulator protein-glutamate methylesterase [Planctomycetes bacterium]|nr:chemotaxis response regulator protein-glutamate methylesterase [Planctomycetota bacterium]
MANKLIRVLVVDDSALLREILCDIVESSEGLVVAGTAKDGEDALVKIAELQPDIVTLDVQMPKMDGLETLDAILRTNPIPVIMVSAVTQRAADTTLQALERGALDYIAKPDSLKSTNTAFRHELLQKIRNMVGTDVKRVLRIRQARTRRSAMKANTSHTTTTSGNQALQAYDDCCIALGISTGGPPALTGLFQLLEPPLPPIVVVQHMPKNFTAPFAARLDSISPIAVREAKTGDVLRPNEALVAPGGSHLRLRRQGSRVVVQIRDGESVSGHKPSVDVMMHHASEAYQDRCLGVIMTGMGHDGAEGCGEIRKAGGYVLGQNGASSDVYGMNKVAFTQGNVDEQFALDDLPAILSRQCKKMFQPVAANAV